MKQAGIALIVALCLYLFGHHKGWAERDAEMQAEIAQKNEQAREAEHKLTEQLNSTATQLNEANNVITQKQSALDRAINSGRVRINSGCVQASSSATTTSGNNETASESERETLRLIAEIAAEGDRAINKLNACITAYEQVRSQVNADR